MLRAKVEFIKGSVHSKPKAVDMAVRLFTIFQSFFFLDMIFPVLVQAEDICRQSKKVGACVAAFFAAILTPRLESAKRLLIEDAMLVLLERAVTPEREIEFNYIFLHLL